MQSSLGENIIISVFDFLCICWLRLLVFDLFNRINVDLIIFDNFTKYNRKDDNFKSYFFFIHINTCNYQQYTKYKPGTNWEIYLRSIGRMFNFTVQNLEIQKVTCLVCESRVYLCIVNRYFNVKFEGHPLIYMLQHSLIQSFYLKDFTITIYCSKYLHLNCVEIFIIWADVNKLMVSLPR